MSSPLRNPLRPWRVGALGRNTLLTSSALAFRAAMQAGYLIIASRWLGAGDYGLFAGSVTAAVLLAPLSGWGMGYVFTERLSHAPGHHAALWRAVATRALVSGVIFSAIVVVATQFLLPVRTSLESMVLLALAELLALPLAQVSSTALLALDRTDLAAISTCLVPALRLGGVAALVMGGVHASIQAIAVTHCLGSAVGAAVMLGVTARVARRRGVTGAPLIRGRSLTRDGAPYAASALASSAYFEVDKVLILQLLGAGTAGVYTAAFRVVAVFVLPVTALLGNSLPRMFAAERDGTPRPLIRLVTTAGVGYAVAGMAVAMLVAPFVPVLFGTGYGRTAQFVALLAPWVPLYALHMCGAAALVAAGGKMPRLLIESSGLALVVGLDLLLLPRLGVSGAVVTLLAVELAMAAGCWWSLHRRHALKARV